MRDIRDMEKEAARIAALSPDDRARYDAELLAHRQDLGLEPRDALADVAAERRRQIEAEGWSPQHDDKHYAGTLAKAGALYAANAIRPDNDMRYRSRALAPPTWPWAADWWKPSTPRRMLVKAAALIVAEIERLDRAALSQTQESE